MKKESSTVDREQDIRERFLQKRADWCENGGEIDLQAWKDIGYLLNAVSSQSSRVAAMSGWNAFDKLVPSFSPNADFQKIREAFERGLAMERRRQRVLTDALELFAECDLNDDNCASLDVATRRIRTIARRALSDAAQETTE